MTLRLGDTAPDFTQDSTAGPIHFHDWIGDGWCVLFSHPKDFTPVCTTELGEAARLKPEFEKRGCKVIGLSVDPLEDHEAWKGDIEETQGTALNFQEILRTIDSLQLIDQHKVATPVNWKDGDDVIIVPALSNEQAKARFPKGWKELKPYLRIVEQPS